MFTARVEKCDQRPSFEIDGSDIRSLQSIAAHARVGEIRRNGSSAMLPADDVVDLMGEVGIFFVNEAVLTPPARAIRNEPSQGVADVTVQAE